MSSTSPAPSPSVSRRGDGAGPGVLGCAALLIAAALLAWGNSFDGPFVLDDLPAIAENATIRSVAAAFSPPGDGQTVSGRPLVNLSFALNWALGGESVRSYHALNLAIHTLAALALFGVVRRTLASLKSQLPTLTSAATLLAFATAAVWLLHPLQTESVTYLSQRAESLAGLCLLLTLYAAMRGADSGAPLGWHALALIACVAGMASKEVMYAAPLLVLLHDRTFRSGTFGAALRRRPTFYASLAGTWLLLGWLVWRTGNRGLTAGFGLGISPWHYLLTQCGAIIHYLRLVVWPAPLILDYGFSVVKSPAEVWPQALALLALFGVTIVGVVRGAKWSFLGAWFFLLLAPSSSLLPVATQTMAEHRMYLPLAAVVAGCVLAWSAAFGRWGLFALAIVALALGLVTTRRNTDYRSAIAIWEDTIAKRPENARAYDEYANALFHDGRLSEALTGYENALRLLPGYPKAHHNYASALAAAGRLDEAATQFQIAIAQSPRLAEAQYGLGNIRREQGRTAEALAGFEAALRLRPDFALAHNNIANLLADAGRTPEAIDHFAAALRAQPNFPDAEYNWGNTLARGGHFAEAVPHYETALRLAPGFVGAHENLGVTFFNLGRTADAVRELEAASHLAPERESIRANLAAARARAGH